MLQMERQWRVGASGIKQRKRWYRSSARRVRVDGEVAAMGVARPFRLIGPRAHSKHRQINTMMMFLDCVGFCVIRGGCAMHGTKRGCHRQKVLIQPSVVLIGHQKTRESELRKNLVAPSRDRKSVV